MKTRESGMPDEPVWSEFFRPEEVLERLGLQPECGDVVDFGCGYGTFAIPAARIVQGTVHALEIEPTMVAATRAKAAGIPSLRVYSRDFVAEGSGLADNSVGYAMLFNILHCEEPLGLLREAWRVLVPGGTLAVMHWNHDPKTPRGPSMDIRPPSGRIVEWAKQTGVLEPEGAVIDLPPWHYGLRLRRTAITASGS